LKPILPNTEEEEAEVVLFEKPEGTGMDVFIDMGAATDVCMGTASETAALLCKAANLASCLLLSRNCLSAIFFLIFDILFRFSIG